MRESLPAEIQQLIGRCEIGETKFSNDDMSAALYCCETLRNRLDDILELCDSEIKASERHTMRGKPVEELTGLAFRARVVAGILGEIRDLARGSRCIETFDCNADEYDAKHGDMFKSMQEIANAQPYPERK